MRRCLGLVVLSTCWLVLLVEPGKSQPDKAEADRQAIVSGVKTIGFPGVPGPLSVFGAEAFVVVAAELDRGTGALVAAGKLGKGRVAALGHTGYFDEQTILQGDTGKLLVNLARWVGGPKLRPVGVREAPAVARWLASQGFRVVLLDGPNWAGQLNGLGAVFVPSHSLRPAQSAALIQHVTRGGGVVTNGLAWGWLQLNPGKSLPEHPGNQLLSRAGIAWADGTFKTPANRLVPLQPIEPASHVLSALSLIEQAAEGKHKLTAAESVLLPNVLGRFLEAVPASARTSLQPRLGKLLQVGGDIVPRANKPLRDDGMARVLLAVQTRLLEQLPAREVKAHPAAKVFPGEVPTEAKAVSRKRTIDTRTPGWHSTGLYARAGQVVTVQVPSSAVNLGLRVQIGCHTDQLWHLSRWQRVPDIVRRFPLRQATTEIASAFGGLVYIDVPNSARATQVEVMISGVVEAPLFVLGKTPLDEWRLVGRNHPGPWAELATDKLILTVPSALVRKLDFPDRLMQFWDRVLDACADLATIPRERRRPERIVHDVQISAGYMHSGYPIMAPTSAASESLDLDTLLARGNWGYFHELGHNHQQGDWTFDGTVEVTVNLFTLYILDTLCPKAPRHGEIQSAAIARNTRKYQAGGSRFADWKQDPFLALVMYVQLQEAFGWDAYKRVFAEYRQLPTSDRPRSEEDKRDQWMVRFSRTVGKNLGPFFERWGVPTSARARQSIAHLPEWQPDK